MKALRCIAAFLAGITMFLSFGFIAASANEGVEINETNFPDSVFRQYVSDNFDTDSNGTLSDDEINAVEKITCNNSGCRSFKGIEFFTELNYLQCKDNELTELDVSHNTKLLEILCSNNRLTGLDISRNAKLEYLKCDSNNITDLDISNSRCLLEAYIAPDDIDKYDTYIRYKASLDLKYELRVDRTTNIITDTPKSDTDKHKNDIAINDSNFPDPYFRKYVSDLFDTDYDDYLSDSECKAVTEINLNASTGSLKGIEYFPELDAISCGGCRVKELDVSHNAKLTYINCMSNEISELDLSNNPKLEILMISDNNLSSLDLSNNTELVSIICQNNQLTALDVSKLSKLEYLVCTLNQLTEINISNNELLLQAYRSPTDTNSSDTATMYIYNTDDEHHYAFGVDNTVNVITEASADNESAAGGADENTSDSVSDDKRDNASTGFFAGKFFGIKLTFVVVAIIVSLLAIVAVLAALAIIHANKAKHGDD